MSRDASPFFPNSLDETLHVEHAVDGSWAENSFDTGTNDQGSKRFVERRAITKRVFAFFVIVFISFSAIGVRVGYLQIVRGAVYRDMAEGNRQRIIPIPAERGLLFDHTGVQLTKNVPNFSLALVPQDLPRDAAARDAMIVRLASITHTSVDDVRENIDTYGSYSYESIILQDDLDYETALRIQIEAADIPGIHIHRGSKRLYAEGEEEKPLPVSLSHILGYLGKLTPEELELLHPLGYLPSDTIGKVGVEKQYETALRGTYGSRRVEVDALGKEQKTIAEVPPVDGAHLGLTIDIQMQRELEQILQTFLDSDASVSRAAAIAMDPRDGSVRAMVSLPGFDNNDFSGGIDAPTYASYIEDPDRPLFNRAISGMYPSGSIIKPAIAAAALQEGIITAKTTFLSTGGIQVGPWFFPDWQAGGHGRTDVRRSIAWSVNTFYYIIGGGYEDVVGLGVETITQYLRLFGFASRLNIDLPGEAAGFLPSKEWKEEVKGERWYVGDTYNLSIGQGDVLVTPLQLTTYIASIANGGVLPQPHLLEKTIDILHDEDAPVAYTPIRDIPINPSYIQTVKLGMKDCVDYGSCRRLSLLPFSSGAKTGTAQWSSVKEPHAWFTAFAPFENPEIVLTVLIEEGEGGSVTAAPVAYDFLRWWGSYRTSGT